MNKHIQLTQRGHRDPGLPERDDKTLWQRPDLTYLGRLGDLVQGGPGKSTGFFDSDQNGNQQPRPK